MQNTDDVLNVWEAFKKRDSEVLYFVKCSGLKDAVETSLEMKKENFDLIGMYTYNQLVDMGILK